MTLSDLGTARTPERPGGSDLVKDTTTQAFTADVLDESRHRPVLVDFWAPWCGPCRTLSPIIEKAVKAANGAVRLVKMNIDDHPSIAGQLGIQSIPAVIAFVDARPVDGFVGALPESQVKAFIDRLVGPEAGGGGNDDVAAILAEGDRLLAAGDAAQAAEMYAAARELDPQSVTALAGIARCQIATGDLAAAETTLAAVPAAATDAAVIAARAQLKLAAEAAKLPDAATLAERIAADPKDHQARFELALLLNARGDRAGAIDRLLEIVARDRNWQEEKARKQLVQFFEAWGPTDEATVSGRRRLSSLLFA
jgi:putative thioredoxin